MQAHKVGIGLGDGDRGLGVHALVWTLTQDDAAGNLAKIGAGKGGCQFGISRAVLGDRAGQDHIAARVASQLHPVACVDQQVADPVRITGKVGNAKQLAHLCQQAGNGLVGQRWLHQAMSAWLGHTTFADPEGFGPGRSC